MWGSDYDNVYTVGGGRLNGSTTDLPLIYHYDGTNWKEARPLLPVGFSAGYLYDVWGSSASDVYLLGLGTDASGRDLPLLYHNDGTGWTETTLSLPFGWSEGKLFSVWGSSPEYIYLAGRGTDSTGHQQPLLYHSSGAGWMQVVLAAPSDASGSYLNDIWGSSASDIYAVGTSFDANHYNTPLLYHNDGSGWTQIAVSLPAGWTLGYLYGVSGSGTDNNVYLVGEGAAPSGP